MFATSEARQPTGLKLHAALKAQLAADAQNAGLSLHAFIIQTLADAARRSRLRGNFAQDVMAALDEMKAGGYLARYEFDDQLDWVLVARVRHQRESGYTASEL